MDNKKKCCGNSMVKSMIDKAKKGKPPEKPKADKKMPKK